ncbi:hypothetical protein GBA52_000510 [Prunus armeniaca]|nr:hypothetical protein GBA52_000510 [Prunus armeniaca]
MCMCFQCNRVSKAHTRKVFLCPTLPVPSEKVYVDVGNILLFGTTCAMPKQDEDEHINRRVLVIQVRCYDCKYQIKGFADTRT